ncbi:Predicted glycosyl transferase [Acidiphilium rubrum]|uniref:Predicted glycosyl transferase n=2 Tax=Acidocellaceae TaxID=3385905 RepID=A0A8G2CNR9_ACIRU|nr:Predicted glycosyl transferase [Acidiphilium rubrum]
MNHSLMADSVLREAMSVPAPFDRRAIPTDGIASPARMPHRRIKVLLYSHDTFGLGHLRRNLAIADRLLAQQGRFSVRLLTGSPVIHDWSLPRGLQVQPLPPVVKTGAEHYRSRDPRSSFAMTKGYREALILKAVWRYRPDVFLVDHAPAGMNGELLAALALIRRELPATRTILGLRDILDAPDTVKALWHEQEIPELLDQAYDEIFVYGSKALFDVAAGYGLRGRIAERVHYCGHVVAAPDAPCRIAGAGPQAICWTAAKAAGRPVALVTAGGGGDGFFLMSAYIEALNRLPAGALHSAIVTGPLMPHAQKAALFMAAGGRDDIELIDHTTDLMPSLRAADLVVAMAGYNTSAEIIATRKRAILVPRAAPRAEQLMRASLLAGLGVVRAIVPGPDLAGDLARLLPQVMAAPPPPAAVWAALDLNGAERVATHLQAMIPALLGSAS